LIVLAAFISPSASARQAVRARFAAGTFIEIHVATPLTVCEQRDPKGLYRLARTGQLPHFTGLSAPYDEPSCPDFVIDTSTQSLADSVSLLWARLWASSDRA
jgi:adenylylsulfate kinase